jgi:FAD/FMN-containing dehydrogenase
LSADVKIEHRPATEEQVRVALTSADSVRITCLGTKPYSASSADAAALCMADFAGVVDLYEKDQVVVVRAGTPIDELQATLEPHGLCLPLGTSGPEPSGGSVGGSISANLPHTLEGQHGSWRDWLLGLRIMLADGTICNCGSRAVKNVAGYDVHKLFVGARGTLGVILEATLKLFPLAALATPEVERRGDGLQVEAIQRVLPTDLDEAVANLDHAFIDRRSCTIWHGHRANTKRCDYDWLLMSGAPELDERLQALMVQTKAIFDPGGKLNPGELGLGNKPK